MITLKHFKINWNKPWTYQKLKITWLNLNDFPNRKEFTLKKKMRSFCEVRCQSALWRLWSWIHWGLLSFENGGFQQTKTLMIISKNDNLLNVYLEFREYCISYWFKSLSKNEETGPFFWLLLWILFWKYNFCYLYFEYISE